MNKQFILFAALVTRCICQSSRRNRITLIYATMNHNLVACVHSNKPFYLLLIVPVSFLGVELRLLNTC